MNVTFIKFALLAEAWQSIRNRQSVTLVDAALLDKLTKDLSGHMIDPLKTTPWFKINDA